MPKLPKPLDWCDEQVLRHYTRIGSNIPDKHLYKITTTAQGLGEFGLAAWGPYLESNPVACGFLYGVFMNGPDLAYNMRGLSGQVKRNTEGQSIALDPAIEFVSNYNRTIRFPIFSAGVGFLGKAMYEVADHFMTGRPINGDVAYHFAAGFGLLSLASSMYLKDQDPKLLKKAPYWKRACVWLKETVTLEPQPLPVPAKR